MKSTMLIALAGASFLALTSGASAQETSAPPVSASEPYMLGDIVVTARRRNEVLQDVPVTINAVTSQQLDKLNIRKFEDIASVMPGLSMSTNANGIGAVASVRGVNYDVNASGNNGTVEFYLNDAPISAGNLFQGMFDIGQVELLRGPQGTLRGRASPSGSMTVTTAQPHLSQYGGYVNGTVTNRSGYNMQGAVNLPIVEDMLAVRIAGLWDENTGARVNSVHNNQDSASRTRALRLSTRFEPTADLSFGIIWQQLFQNIRSYDQVESLQALDPSAPASPVFIDSFDREAVTDTARQVRQRFDNLNLQAQYSFAGQRLNYVGAMNRQVLNSQGPDDVGDFFSPNFPTFTKGYGRKTHTYSKNWAHEIRLSSEKPLFDGLLDYIVGGFYQKQDVPTNLTNPTVVLFGSPAPCLVSPTAPCNLAGTIVNTPILRTGGSKEQSIYGNLTVHVTDMTELSGGLRYIDYRDDGQLLVGGNAIPGANTDNHDDTIIYTVSAKHRFNESFMAYGTIGSSWRPGINVVGDFSLARSDLENSFLNIAPEKSTSYEIGFKSDWLEKRLRVNVSAFHQNFKNYPYRSASGVFYVETAANTTTTPPTLFQRVTNFNFVAGVPVKVNGVEAEVIYQPLDNWNISGNASYAKSKIKNGEVPCNDYFPNDGVPDTVSGVPTVAQIRAATGGDNISACNVDFRASITPLWSGNLTSEYYHPLAENMDGYVRGLLTVYGKSKNDPSNAIDDVKAYALLNLFAGVRDHSGAWDVSLYAKNILDEKRVLSRSPNPQTTPFNIGATSVTGVTSYRLITMTAPREFGLNVRYAFGSR
ncbi:TonB-dependent receptor plug domain-containing protein [Phenylobacterium sp. LjRoot219]|uniref:TonB-dependent receptor n=1 Tax=Phenylobacterium sp. LjRoot219 TaxID=3342283 RepID=UPI003ECF1CAE